MAVGSIQGKSGFRVAEGELRNSTVAEVYWYPIRKVVKGRWDISWFKNPQGVGPLPNQSNLFLILGVIYGFVILKSNHAYLHILHHFY